METGVQKTVVESHPQMQEVDGYPQVSPKTNGRKNAKKSGHASRNGNGYARLTQTDLSLVLTTLQAMRDGDFSVRLPGDWIGLEGKVADTFNQIIASNQQMAQELRRIGQVI